MNPRAPQCLLPAEMMRGGRLGEDFRDGLSMVRGGWSLFGAPTFDRNGGMVLNGVNQYSSLPLGQELASTTITIHLEWYPAHAAQAGDYILDTSATNRFCIADTGVGLATLFGGVTVHSATYAQWNALLLVGQRNFYTMTKAPGAAAIVWLNGVLLPNSIGITAPSGGATTPLLVGKVYVAGIYYPATFKRLLIGQHAATLAEHLAYWNRTMWGWEDRCAVNLQMRMKDYDPTLVRTLDSSGHGLHATLGDGVTPAKYPAQGNGQMAFDGGDYLSCGDAPALRLTNTGTVLITFRVAALPSYVVLCGKGNFSTGRYGYIFYLDNVTGQLKGGIATAAAAQVVASTAYPTIGPIHSAELVWDGSFVKVYHNGLQVGSVVQTINAVDIGLPYRIGSAPDVESYRLTGAVYDNKVSVEALNPTQILDYHQKMMTRIGSEL